MHRRHILAGLLTATAPLAITRTAVAQVTPAGALPAAPYLAQATRGSRFLEDTSRDAFAKTSDPRIKRFARAEVAEQVGLVGRLGGVAGITAPVAPVPGGPVGAVVAAPTAAASTIGGALGAPAATSPAAPGGGMDAAMADLLAMPGGPPYDAAYVRAQITGHQEALRLHGAYAGSGDDPALRRIAGGALPLIRLHLAQLARLRAIKGGAAQG